MLAVISKLLGLSENLAGVTLLAFGNGSPDIFTSLSNISGNSNTELMYTQLIGGATFVTGFIIGIIMIIRPAKIPARTYVRDVLFFLTAAIYISNSTNDQEYTLVESIITVGIYFVFLGVVIIDHFYMKRQIKQIRKHSNTSSIYDMNELSDLESIVDFQIRSRKDSSLVLEPIELIFIAPLQTSREGANKNLFGRFFASILPINKERWTDGNWIQKVFMVATVSI